MNNAVITATHLAKTYLLYNAPKDRLLQMLWRGKKQFYRTFEALKPLSFSVAAGQTVGIVGQNGSGKSTLLQLLAGTLNPTQGELALKGKVAALLELGAGFNPEFTGRENVYLNGSILGLSQREIDALYADIAAFANIGEFIERPVSTYSSGMVVRLAFAVATASRPDVLIVDEALSVGDEAFQRRCFARIEEMKKAGTTILFVSHSAQTIIQLCDRAIWLDKGEMLMDGAPKQVIDQYHRYLHGSESMRQSLRAQILAGEAESDMAEEQVYLSSAMQEYPADGGKINAVRLQDSSGKNSTSLQHGQRYQFSYEVEITEAVSDLRCGMFIKTRTGVEIAGAVYHLNEHGQDVVTAGTRFTITFSFDCQLYPMTYFLNCGMTADYKGEHRYLHRMVDVMEFNTLNETARNEHGIAPQGLVDLGFKAERV